MEKFVCNDCQYLKVLIRLARISKAACQHADGEGIHIKLTRGDGEYSSKCCPLENKK